ncbi:hypothetical protein ANANG_G00237240 [Anguilla anguilla]|uniref:Uncharacterized protein n=1 Tax=Anguilla anguilla TaxID=7936 RepID=A0A9D3LYI6_ANGAN|nr:hypothetical protein ANANG_G00237240 [Anguilla anguilla]
MGSSYIYRACNLISGILNCCAHTIPLRLLSLGPLPPEQLTVRHHRAHQLLSFTFSLLLRIWYPSLLAVSVLRVQVSCSDLSQLRMMRYHTFLAVCLD